MEKVVARGDIWYCDLQGYSGSNVTKGYRPVVVVSSYLGIKTSDLVTVCPMSTSLKPLSCNVEIGPIFEQGESTQVLANQITTVPIEMLKKKVGSVSRDSLKKIDRGILTSLGITHPEDLTIECVKLTEEEIKSFLEKWSKPEAKWKEIAEEYRFNTYSYAYEFWLNHKEDK